jgi:hypothetical protein
MSEPTNVDESDPTTWVILIGTVVAIGGAVLIYPLFVGHHRGHGYGQNACINNLRKIDGAKDQWAIEKKIAAGTTASTNVLEYMAGNRMPVCPEGGTYSLNPMGTNPTCSISSHRLP